METLMAMFPVKKQPGDPLDLDRDNEIKEHLHVRIDRGKGQEDGKVDIVGAEGIGNEHPYNLSRISRGAVGTIEDKGP